MKNLIYADLRRIFHKKSFCILLLLLLAEALLSLKISMNIYATSFNYATSASGAGMFSVIMGVIILSSVYCDEFKSNAMTSVIGRGYSRTKIIIAKFIDAAILTIIVTALKILFVLMLAPVFGQNLDLFEIKMIVFQNIFTFYSILGNIIVASFFLFLTANTASTIFIFLLLEIMVPTVMSLISDIVFIKEIGASRIDLNSISQIIFTDIMLGINFHAATMLFISFMIYFAMFMALSIVCFHKKELDF